MVGVNRFVQLLEVELLAAAMPGTDLPVINRTAMVCELFVLFCLFCFGFVFIVH